VLEIASIAEIAPVAVRRRGFGGVAATRGGKFLCGFCSHVGGAIPCAAAEAQSIALWIVQNGPRLKKIAAPHHLQRLLEEHF
jgi:hypothetical protein